MLICLTGLHKSGKSYFCFESGIPQKYGFEVFNKKNVVIELCKQYYCLRNKDLLEMVKADNLALDKKDIPGAIWTFCNKWYGAMMAKDPYMITNAIITYVKNHVVDTEKNNVILDAVHNNKEWEIIHEIIPKSGLLLFATPSEIRDTRSSDVDFIRKQNIKRIKYWCSDSNLPPLPYMALGTIDGSGTLEEIDTEFCYFIKQLKKSFDCENSSDLTLVSQQDLKLKNLMSENELLAIENAKLRNYIATNNLKNVKGVDDEKVR